MKHISIKHLNNQYNDQLRSLDFYKNELGILRDRLTEIGGKNTGAEILKEVEHYENAFKVQINNIDELSHNIRLNIAEIAKEAQEEHAGYISEPLIRNLEDLTHDFDAEEQTISELRQSFNRFSAAWM